MNFNKRVNGSWVDIPHYIHNTSTDTITTLPADIYPNAVTATVGLKGNMYQASGVSPTTPIQPQECGDLETSGEHSGQYKIPISSANTTTPVYLGEVQTTRKIKKLVLTGDETLTSGSVIGQIRTPLTGAINSLGLCTHYIIKTSYGGAFPYFRIANNVLWFELSPDGYETKEEALADFKAYLAAQYAAGTPVTVWYVLAEPTTGIVNEPIRKIGDYADTVSGITIPTIAGANTLSIGTTLQPSEVTVNYKGWHDASVKEKSENYLDENDFGLVEVAAGTYRVGTDVGVLPSGKYTFNAVKSSSAVQIYRTTKNGSTYNYETITNLPYTFTADGVSNQIFRSAGNTGSSWADLGYTNVMLNTGETAQTYEPYWQ